MARVRERMNLIERTQDTILKIHSFVLKKTKILQKRLQYVND